MRVHKVMFQRLYLRVGNWALQGFRGLSNEERAFKAMFEIVAFTPTYLILSKFYERNISFAISLLLSHSFNYLMATNIWGPRHEISGAEGVLPDSTDEIIIYIQRISKSFDGVTGIAIFGSLSTGKYHSNSDIDIKIYRKDGIVNTIIANILLFYFRSWGNFNRYPIDIYVVGDIKNYEPTEEEVPVILLDKEGKLRNFFSNWETADRFIDRA